MLPLDQALLSGNKDVSFFLLKILFPSSMYYSLQLMLRLRLLQPCMLIGSAYYLSFYIASAPGAAKLGLDLTNVYCLRWVSFYCVPGIALSTGYMIVYKSLQRLLPHRIYILVNIPFPFMC